MNSASNKGKHFGNADDLAFVPFLSVLCLAPLWYASVPFWAKAANGFVLSLVAVYWLARDLSRAARPTSLQKIALPIALGSGTLIWCLLQQWQSVPSWIDNPVWVQAADALERDIAGSISIEPDDTRLAFISLATSAMVFLLAYVFGRDARRASSTLRCIAVAGGCYSAYGLIDNLFDLRMVLFEPKILMHLGPVPTNPVTATFVNRSHFAAYAGLSFLAGSAALIIDFRAWATTSGERTPSSLALISMDLVSCCLCLTAAMMSGSRAGVVVAMGSALLFFCLLLIRRWSLRVALAGMCFVLFIVVMISGSAPSFLSRLGSLSLEELDTTRGGAASVAWQALAANPWVGYGAFVDAFAWRRLPGMMDGLTWNAAHNSYLEAGIVLGVPAALALTAATALCAGDCVAGVFRRRQFNEIPAAAAAVALQMAAHSLVDFVIQTPAVAVTFAAILGAGVAQSFSSRSSAAATSAPLTKLATGAAGLAVALALGWLCAATIEGRLVPPRLIATAGGPPVLDVHGVGVRDRLTATLDRELYNYDAAMRANAAAVASTKLENARVLTEALATRAPGAGNFWALLAQIRALQAGFDGRALKYLIMSERTAPFEALAVRKRIMLAVRNWEALDEVRRAATRQDLRTFVRTGPFDFVIDFLSRLCANLPPGVVAEVRSAIVDNYAHWGPYFDKALQSNGRIGQIK